MGPEQWISVVIAVGGCVGWMTALWIRVGRILQRIDDLVGVARSHKTRLEQHETRLTRLEVFAEHNQ